MASLQAKLNNMKGNKTLFQETYRVETTRVNWHTYNNGIYFVTICTEDPDNHPLPTKQQETAKPIKPHYFGEIHNNEMHYTPLGEYCVQCIEQIPHHWQGIKIHIWTVMPNHVHLIIDCQAVDENNAKERSILPNIIRTLKSAVTREANRQHIPFKWQSRYHEHIIRHSDSYSEIYDYIKNNIARWDSDCFK